MTTRMKRGKTLGYVQEAILGAAVLDDALQMRFNEGLEAPTTAVLIEEQPNLGHENSFEYSDKPITYSGIRESALKLPMFIRRALDDISEQPPLVTFLEAGGCSVTAYGDTTLDAYTSAVAFSLAADKAAVGAAIMVKLVNGRYYPTLVSDYDTALGAYDVIPSMALPSPSINGARVEQMLTVHPVARAVPSTKTVGFRLSTRGFHTAGDDLAFDLTGCSLAQLESLTFAPRQSMLATCTFHVGGVEQVEEALAAASFLDGAKYVKLNDMFEFGFASADSDGGIATTTGSLISADVDLGLRIIPVPGEGNSTDYHGIQGYAAYNDPPTVKLKMLLDRAKFEDLEGDNDEKYMHFVQPVTDLSDPAIGLWIPRAYLIDTVAEPFNDEYMTCTLTYKGTAPLYGATTANGSKGMSPWVLAMSHVTIAP